MNDVGWDWDWLSRDKGTAFGRPELQWIGNALIKCHWIIEGDCIGNGLAECRAIGKCGWVSGVGLAGDARWIG